MITIDNSKCKKCKQCIEICHQSCITLSDSKIIIDAATCSTCMQCIAICQSQALGWDNVMPAKFEDEKLPGFENLDELLRQRRTIRNFKQDKVDRMVLKELVGYAMYAPAHARNFRAIIIDDDFLIDRTDKIIFTHIVRLDRFIFRSIIFRGLLIFVPVSLKAEYYKAKLKIENSIKRGKTFKSKPPALILIVGERNTPYSLESAQYALYNINLMAQTKGLGCRNLVGNQNFINADKTFRKSIGLQKNEKVFAMMAIGYPAVRFGNKISNRNIRINWNQ